MPTEPAFLPLLPEYLRADATAQAVAAAFDAGYLPLVGDLPAACPRENLHSQTEPVLGIMAYEVNPLYWDESWPDATKRSVLENATRWRMIHGTAPCVEEFVGTVLGTKAVVVPWWHYGGEPGRFRVLAEVTEYPLTDSQMDEALKIIQRAKNARSHLDALAITFAARSKAHAAAVCLLDEVITIKPYTPKVETQPSAAHPASVVDTLETIRLEAK